MNKDTGGLKSGRGKKHKDRHFCFGGVCKICFTLQFC